MKIPSHWTIPKIAGVLGLLLLAVQVFIMFNKGLLKANVIVSTPDELARFEASEKTNTDAVLSSLADLKKTTEINFTTCFANDAVLSNRQSLFIADHKLVIHAIESIDKALSNQPPVFKSWPDSRSTPPPWSGPEVTSK